MKALSLFTGIMGIDIACEWAGIETIVMCEKDEFCQKVIRKHKPNIPLYDDVCELTRERMELDGIDCGTIDLIHGGEPCQPYSLAGKRSGEADDRYLWKEVKRLLQEIRPRWYVRENVAGNISLGIDQVLSDLDNIGYTAEPVDIPACGVGADHRRERIFIIAHTKSEYSPSKNEQKSSQEIQKQFGRRIIKEIPRPTWEEHKPPVCGVDDGIPGRFYLDRMKALGNSVNPYQIYPILAAIKQIDDMLQVV